MKSLESKNGMQAIHITQIIYGFAYSLIGIFIPIYLLNLGYNFRDIIFFFIYHNIFLLLFSFAAAYLARWIGLKKILILGLPFHLIYFYLLYNLADLKVALWFLAALDSIKSAMYFVPLNVLFGRFSDSTKLSGAVSKLMAFPQIAGIFGPFIGGVVIAIWGYQKLFILSFVFLFVASIFLLFSKNIPDHYSFSFFSGWNFFRKRPRFIISELFDNLGGETEGIIWPIFVYLNLINVASVGLLGTLVALGGSMFTLMIGNFSDKYNKAKMMKIGTALLFAVWLARFFFNNEIVLYSTTLLAGFMLSLVLVPYTSIIFKEAKDSRNESFFVFKELPTVLGRISLFLIALLFLDNIKLIFPIAGLSYISFYFLSNNKNIKLA